MTDNIVVVDNNSGQPGDAFIFNYLFVILGRQLIF